MIFWRKNPAAKKLFEEMVIPVEDVNAENWKLHNGETSYDAIHKDAEDWADKNKAKFDAWIADAKNAAK